MGVAQMERARANGGLFGSFLTWGQRSSCSCFFEIPRGLRSQEASTATVVHPYHFLAHMGMGPN